jgi:hypothetical protein
MHPQPYPQTFLFIVSITGGIGWFLLLLLAAYCISVKEKYDRLIADHKALQKTYSQTAIQLKNHTNPIIDAFQRSQTKPGQSTCYVDEKPAPRY